MKNKVTAKKEPTFSVDAPVKVKPLYIPPKKTRVASGYKLILGYLGIFMALIGVITLIPLVMVAFYWSEWTCWADFVIPGGSAIALGLTFYFIFLHHAEKAKLEKHQDSVLLVAIWLFAVALGAFPFFLMGKIDGAGHTYSYTEAFFESTSGYATTGFTIFKDVLDGATAFSTSSETFTPFCPHIFLFYRSFTQFIGGVGLVLIVASVISDRYGMKLYYAEGHNDKLLPNLGKSAKIILSIYTAYILVGTLALWLFGMDWFDALNHSIAALATGGFSTRSTSITYFIDASYVGNGILPYNQWGMEITMCVLMLLGATSFVLHLNIIRFKWKKFFRDCEVRFAAIFLTITILLMAIGIMTGMEDSQGKVIGTNYDFWTALHYAAFQTISCLTTTGFSNVAYIVHLGSAALFLSVICMIIGGGMGSTAGAIKQYRIILIAKEIHWDFKYRFAPSRMLYPHLITRAGETKEVEVGEYKDASLYALFYLGVLAAGSLALSFFPGYNFQEGIYEFASGLSGTGNSIVDFYAYKASYSYSLVSYDCTLWILSIAMFIGRLEITPVYFALYRTIRDIAHKETV